MKPEILAIRQIYAPVLAELESEFIVHKLWTAPDPDAFIRDVAANVRGVVTTGLDGLSSRYFKALPKVEIVACFGTPRGTVDLAAARERHVIVTNTPDVIADTVADLAVGLLVAVMRRICEGDRFVKTGKWLAGPISMGSELGGKTCGIIGLGKIGRGIGKRVEAFGMSVCYRGPRRKPEVPYPYIPDLESMARQSDCLVIACAASPATVNMVDTRILDALGPEAYLINVARGSIVNQGALIAALRDKRIAGAGLDVFWDEPQVPQELIDMDNVVLSPHMGSSTREIRIERGRKLLANLRAHFAGKPVLTPVT